jgi:hypothetical protein
MDQTSKRENLEKKDLKKRIDLEVEKTEIREEKERGKMGKAKEEIEIKKEIKVVKEKRLVPQVPPVPSKKSLLQEEIEDILEGDLEGIYQSLTPVQQREFREKGEETAFKISILIQQAKIKIKQILKLIIEWLKLIPGVNKFFLEQEAKIKTDKVLQLKSRL